MRDRAKKITFPPADSESEIQIPLVLGATDGRLAALCARTANTIVLHAAFK
jgi:hypothetical protein